MEEENKYDKNPVPKLTGRYIKWTAYGLLILLFSIMQTTPHMVPSFFGALPLPLLSLTVCIAMMVGPVGGGAAGVASGLLWDLYADRLLGFNALLLLIIGCGCGLLVRLLLRNNLLSAMLLTAGALVFQGGMDWAFNYLLVMREEPVYFLLHRILPNMAYTFVITPLIYLLVYGVSHLLRRRE